MVSSVLAAFRNPCLRIPRNLFPANEQRGKEGEIGVGKNCPQLCAQLSPPAVSISRLPPLGMRYVMLKKKSFGCAMDGYNAIGYEAEGVDIYRHVRVEIYQPLEFILRFETGSELGLMFIILSCVGVHMGPRFHQHISFLVTPIPEYGYGHGYNSAL